MPVLKHAKKKLRQDVKRTRANKRVREAYKSLLKKARAARTKEAMSAAFSAIDKAAKQNIIHKNKAARLKSSLSKPVTQPATPKTETKPAKKAEKAAEKTATKAPAKKTTKKVSTKTAAK